MKEARYTDKKEIVRILSYSFAENKSVASLVKKGDGYEKRVELLMNYAFDECWDFGAVYLSDDSKACALIIFPEQKKITLKSILRTIKLVFTVIGVFSVFKVSKKESIVSKMQNADRLKYYVWFLGVDVPFQSRGIGKRLLSQLIDDSSQMNRQLLLETSTERNLPFYTDNGLLVYSDVNVGYKLYFLKSDIS